MDAFNAWWGGLAVANQWFFIAAGFFSVFFLWQLIMAFVGLGGGDMALESDAASGAAHVSPGDTEHTVDAFKLLSVRSLLAFGTLFSWAGALYLSRGVALGPSLAYALLWGLAAMALVAVAMNGMRKLTESGNLSIASCVGTTCTVYLNIPAGGVGEVQVLCSGMMTNLKACSADGLPLPAGTRVRVLRVAGANTLEVAAAEPHAQHQGGKTP